MQNCLEKQLQNRETMRGDQRYSAGPPSILLLAHFKSARSAGEYTIPQHNNTVSVGVESLMHPF